MRFLLIMTCYRKKRNSLDYLFLSILFCATVTALHRSERMRKNITTLLFLIAAMVLSLSCRKALELNSNSTAGESNSNAAQSQPCGSSQPTPMAVDKDKMLKQLITVEKEF